MAAATPRQYRPTYTYLPPAANTPRSQYVSALTRPTGAYSRRRTTSNFPIIDPLHSRPTVASSRLTASTSCNDIINPACRGPRQSLPVTSDVPCRRTTPFPFGTFDDSRRSLNASHGFAFSTGARAKTPTRIPTPISAVQLLSQKRVVVNPIRPFTDQEDIQVPTYRFLATKENLIPVGTRTLTKSRTMNALNTVRSALTRSSHDLKALATPQSAGSIPTKPFLTLKSSPQVATSKTSPPLPEFTTNVRQVSTAMPSAYWAGRFTALYDRFRSEILSRDDLLESPFFRKILLQPKSIILQNEGSIRGLDGKLSISKLTKPFDYETTEHITQARRAFVHLEALCLTKEAEKSLRGFRISYARLEGNRDLLPPGVKLGDDPEDDSFMAKAGRIFSGSGRKSSFGMPLKTSKSRMGLRMSIGHVGG